MKRSIIVISLLIASQLTVLAQPDSDQRTVSTRIADILARFPAQTKAQVRSNMEMLSALDKNGFSEMLGMLAAPGKGDNTSLEYAISAYSSYTMLKGNEEKRQAATKLYCAALDNAALGYTREFIIRQLQAIGKDDAVPCLSKYLNDKQLGEPAARALAQIHSAAAGKALLQALPSSSGPIRHSLISALGYSRYKPAVSAISALASSNDSQTRKLSLYALAMIADPSSGKLLQQAAKKAGFTYEDTEAASAYLLYISNLNKDGNKTLAARLSGELVSQAKAAGQLHTRIAGLKLLTEFNGSKSLPLLYRAMQDQDKEYRAAALLFARKFGNSYVDRQWMNTIAAASPEAKVQIIDHLALSSDKNLLPQLKKYLDSDLPAVRIAAIRAVGKIGGESAIPALLEKIKNSGPEEIAAIKQALLLVPGNKIGPQITADLQNMPATARVAILEVLAARAADESAPQVFNLLNAPDTAVHRAAVNALPFVVTSNDLPKLFELINAADSSDLPSVQRAVVAATSGITDTIKRTSVITTQLKQSGAQKQYVYLDVLAAVGGKEATDAIIQVFKNGDTRSKLAAISALSKMNDACPASTLIEIAKDNSRRDLAKVALDGYIGIIAKSSFPADQKVLMLQEAMAEAQNDAQRKRILREASENHTFLSLVFAGKYLDDAELQQQAANAVMRIARSENNFYGKIVRDLVAKTIEVLKGRDSDYEKQALRKILAEMPAGDGFVPLFNGKDLSGWKGLVANPVERKKMDASTLATEQQKANEAMRQGWEVKDGLLIFTGHGNNLATEKMYGDFEMFVDWKITEKGDAGIYLRGTPQVQIWDTSRTDVGAQVGSGGLYNNQKHISKPLVLADNAIGDWNTFHIIMKGEKVTVYLNGILVTDNTVLENYWDRNAPIFPKEQIELQAHGTYVAYRNIYLREIKGSEPFVLSKEEKDEGFEVLFDGTNLNQWTGDKTAYSVDNGDILVNPHDGSGGNLYTNEEYSDFVFRFEFQLTPGANNGLGIRAPLKGDAAYVGMELQILDNEADIYKNLHEYQYHGSVYGVIPAKRGFLKPTGEWNEEEVIAKGSWIKVILNGTVILDGDIAEASRNGTMDKRDHPGLLRRTGHIGFLGHGSIVRFRDIRVKKIDN